VYLAINKPIMVVIGNVTKYQGGIILKEDKVSNKIQRQNRPVIILNAVLKLGSAMVRHNIVPSQVARKETR
jgi:hypothetical protein